MKFRDPKTGEVFEDIQNARTAFCEKTPCTADDCPLACAAIAERNPTVAASMMELEVVEDKEESTMGQVNQMEQSTKPRICEVLGVEVGEQATYSDPEEGKIDFRVLDDGNVEFTFKGGKKLGNIGMGYAIVQAINHPDRILRKPRFTEEEAAEAKEIRRIFGRTDIIKRTDDGVLCYGHIILNSSLLPTLRPGQAISLEEVINTQK